MCDGFVLSICACFYSLCVCVCVSLCVCVCVHERCVSQCQALAVCRDCMILWALCGCVLCYVYDYMQEYSLIQGVKKDRGTEGQDNTYI